MINKYKIYLLAPLVLMLNGCAIYYSAEYVESSCITLKKNHDQVGAKVRKLMVSSLRKRKSYRTANIVAKSYSNWPIYFLVKGDLEFNQTMGDYKLDYQKIRYASINNKCTYFRDMIASDAYKKAEKN